MYDSGNFEEIVDSQSRSSIEACGLAGKYQLMYDNISKAYLISLHSATLTAPKSSNSSLDITSSTLILQVFLFKDTHATIEIVVSDSENIQRKIILDSKKRIFKSALATSLPNLIFFRNTWVILALDIESLFSFSFPNAEFKKIDSIVIWGTMYLRKILAVNRFLQEYTKSFLLMDRVDVAIQEIDRNMYIGLKQTQNSPIKGYDFKSSPREKSLESPLCSMKSLKSGYVKTLWKKSKGSFNSPNIKKNRDTDILEERQYKIAPGPFSNPKQAFYKHSSSFKAQNKFHENYRDKNDIHRNTPICLEKLKHIPKPNFFQKKSIDLLQPRHNTPPFVNTREGFVYNQFEKNYIKL